MRHLNYEPSVLTSSDFFQKISRNQNLKANIKIKQFPTGQKENCGGLD